MPVTVRAESGVIATELHVSRRLAILPPDSSRQSMLSEEFDQAYVDALRARDPATERHFFDYFGRRLRGKLRGLGKEDAEDVRQETFARVLSIVHSAEGVRTPQALGAL